MKTKTQKQNSELKNRTEQSSTKAVAQTPAAPPALPNGQSGSDKKDNRLPIDSAQRQTNRSLPTEKVLHLLLTGAPELYRIAEVVGKWVWVQFKAEPKPEIRQTLSQFGFHWNRTRQAWQHPCGKFSLSSVADPRTKYQSYHPSDMRTA